MSENKKHYTKKSETKRGNFISRKPKKRYSQTKNKNLPTDQVLHLQRTIGNRAVNRLIQSGAIQAKLTVGKPNSIYEKEADRVADRVMSMKDKSLVNGHSSLGQRKSTYPECPERKEVQSKPLAEQITPLIRRQAEEEEKPAQTKLLQRREGEDEKEAQTKLQRQAEEEEKQAQSKAAPGGTPVVTPNIEANINSMKGGGQPLSESTRSFFEPRFGADFSRVRIHNNTKAANTAQAINAKAFTTGKDVIFNSDQYSPGTSYGKRLLAHELTHVVQQVPGRSILQRLTAYGHHLGSKGEMTTWKGYRSGGGWRRDWACFGNTTYGVKKSGVRKLEPLGYCKVKNKPGYGTSSWAIHIRDNVTPRKIR